MSNTTTMDRVRTVIGIAAIFVALVGGVLIIQREVTNRVVEIRDVPEAITANVEVNDVQVDSSGQTELRYYENKSSDQILIFFHGAAGPDNEKASTAAKFVNVQAPTFETNTIAPIPLTDQKLYDTVDLSIEDALSRGFEYENISVMGFSMGGAQAVYAAVHYPELHVVIPIGTFTSFRDACVGLVGVGASTCILIPEEYLLTETIAGDAQAPIHQYHSRDDKVVDFADGRRLFTFLGSEQKQFTEISGEHSDYDIVQILSDNL